MVASQLGPISTALEAELRQRVQQNGIVIWLDRDGHYTELVDRLQNLRAEEQLPYAVHGFRGSHLALMVDLDDIAAGSDPPRLLIHLPGFTEDTVTLTPVLGLYRSGVRFRKALGTLIREAMEQGLSDRQDALFSLRAPDEARGRAVVGEQSVQGGLAVTLGGPEGTETWA